MSTFCFDLDGTLCTNTEGAYEQAVPIPWAIARVNALAAAGHRILIYTARGSSTGIDWREETVRQLRRWGVSFDELMLGKPTADVFVDDRAYGIERWQAGQARTFTEAPLGHSRAPAGFLHGLSGTPLPLNTRFEVGRTFGGRALWLEEHLDALCTGLELREPRDELVPRLREAIEPPSGVLGGVAGEIVFALHCATGPHAAYLDLYPGYPTVGVSCRTWAEPAAALASAYPRPGCHGTVTLSLTEAVHGSPCQAQGVTAAHVAAAARASGVSAIVAAGAPRAGEAVLVSSPFPLLPQGECGPLLTRVADVLAAETGVDLLAELEQSACPGLRGPGAVV